MLGLFFSSYEEDSLALLGNGFQFFCGLVDFSDGLVKVDDVNAVALHEDVGSHGRIPFAFEVAKVTACLKKSFKRCS